jgi:hypothetical protein
VRRNSVDSANTFLAGDVKQYFTLAMPESVSSLTRPLLNLAVADITGTAIPLQGWEGPHLLGRGNEHGYLSDVSFLAVLPDWHDVNIR